MEFLTCLLFGVFGCMPVPYYLKRGLKLEALTFMVLSGFLFGFVLFLYILSEEASKSVIEFILSNSTPPALPLVWSGQASFR